MFELCIKAVTPYSVLLSDGSDQAWFSLSKISYKEELIVGNIVKFKIPEQLAMDKGFI